MKKTTLLFAGLLVAGLGLTGCAEQTVESTSQAPASTATQTTPEKTPEPVVRPESIAFAKGATTCMGAPTTAELVLLDTKNCKVDIGFGGAIGADAESKLDAPGTYKIVDGIVTATVTSTTTSIGGDEIPGVTTELVFNLEGENAGKANYIVQGKGKDDKPGLTLTYPLTATWANTDSVANGSTTCMGAPTTAALFLTDTKNCKVDIGFGGAIGADAESKLDAPGTYKIENGILTATVTSTTTSIGGDEIPGVTTTLVFNLEGENAGKANYVVQGKGKDDKPGLTLTYPLTLDWSHSVPMPEAAAK